MENRREFPNAREALQYLETRINERKDLERRQKFVNDLQGIRNRRNLDIDSIPVPPNHDQEAWFAKLESNGVIKANKIWEKVLRFVTNPSDVTSAYFTCEMFQKHLEEKRKLMLLSQVFGVLRDQGHLVYSYCHKVSSTKIGGRENREVLNQRLVSKAWKDAAESQFLVVPVLTGDGPKFKSQYNFLTIPRVDKAMKALGSPDRCSPLIRAVTISDEQCRNKSSFYSKLLQFLEIHGGSMWSLLFSLIPNDDGTLNYEGLRSVIKHMSHLKSLDLMGNRELSSVAKERLLQMMVDKPFPNMPSLETCKIHLWPRPLDFMVVDILTKCENLKKVKMFWDSRRNNRIPDSVWNALRSRRLEHFELEMFAEDGNDFIEHLLRLGQCDWPLKSLSISLLSSEPVAIGASRIWALFNHFGGTLEDFQVKTKLLVRIVTNGRNIVVDAPNLKKINCNWNDFGGRGALWM